jgi:hypothetical protein
MSQQGSVNLRVGNRDGQADRLIDLRERTEISAGQFWDLRVNRHANTPARDLPVACPTDEFEQNGGRRDMDH